MSFFHEGVSAGFQLALGLDPHELLRECCYSCDRVAVRRKEHRQQRTALARKGREGGTVFERFHDTVDVLAAGLEEAYTFAELFSQGLVSSDLDGMHSEDGRPELTVMAPMTSNA